ncbi:hypothetical protein Tco_0841477 [Tanacetum coccineum]|uniref:Uncharacterized protein n=1 Tax=Tanacetum coccineum TaxID=301880 RepID=A0ABQ5AWH6_9ASTR
MPHNSYPSERKLCSMAPDSVSFLFFESDVDEDSWFPFSVYIIGREEDRSGNGSYLFLQIQRAFLATLSCSLELHSDTGSLSRDSSNRSVVHLLLLPFLEGRAGITLAFARYTVTGLVPLCFVIFDLEPLSMSFALS